MDKMPIHCTICTKMTDGLRSYGQSSVCSKECYNEYNRRRSYAIVGKPLPPNKYITTQEYTKFMTTQPDLTTPAK